MDPVEEDVIGSSSIKANFFGEANFFSREL